MKTVTSKLTRKYQATIPAAVRNCLELQAGDAVAFDIESDGVKLRKAQSLDLEYLRSVEETLSEWSTAEDEEGYAGL